MLSLIRELLLFMLHKSHLGVEAILSLAMIPWCKTSGTHRL